MAREYRQTTWDAHCEDDCRQLVRLAVREDLDRGFDWTTVSLVPPEAKARALVVARKAGTVAGLSAASTVLREMNAAVDWKALVAEGAEVTAGQAVAEMSGSARDMLTCERIVLNFMGRLSGVATLTRQYVTAVAETKAGIYDTRKTTPGWRRLEKFAVRCGGGKNHRLGLFDGILIKDNHLALGGHLTTAGKFSPAEAVLKAREFLRQGSKEKPALEELMVEIEVDTLEQFDLVLPTRPDIVLLDNMTTTQLREAVARRDQSGLPVELEASGGVNLTTVRDIARTGVDRISVGALTHSAVCFDLGLDWE